MSSFVAILFLFKHRQQAPDVDFNRALCMNIGFLEAKRYDYQCFIFHDVDLIPENDNNVYSCPENPRHMSVAIDKFGYELPYIGLFGGVTAMTMDQFEIVNGYSNKFFGWGGEDDDLYKRIRNLGMSITRYTPDVSSYRMLRHQADSNPNNDRLRLLENSLDRWKEDGINTVRYQVLQTVNKHMYTYILAGIDQEHWVYQPWRIGNNNRSRDDSFDYAAEELFLDKAKYLLGKFVLDKDLVHNLKKEFYRLNTSDVSMEDISAIIRRMFPVTSPEAMVVPELIQSSGNESKTNNQTGLRNIGLLSQYRDRAKELDPDLQKQEKQYSVQQSKAQPHWKHTLEHMQIQENSKPVQPQQNQRENQHSIQQVEIKQEHLNPVQQEQEIKTLVSQVIRKQENNLAQKGQEQRDRNPVKVFQAQQNPFSVQQTEQGNQNQRNTNINTAFTENQKKYQQRLKTHEKYRQSLQNLQDNQEVKPRQSPIQVFQKLSDNLQQRNKFLREVHQPVSLSHKTESVNLNKTIVASLPHAP